MHDLIEVFRMNEVSKDKCKLISRAGETAKEEKREWKIPTEESMISIFGKKPSTTFSNTTGGGVLTQANLDRAIELLKEPRYHVGLGFGFKQFNNKN
jgi:hypothetical protein